SNLVSRARPAMPGDAPSRIEAIAMRQRVLARLAFAISIVLVSLFPLHEGYCAELPVALPSEAQRPGAESGPTRVSVGIWVADISQIDSVAQTFSANLGIVLRWQDPTLAHGEPGVKRYNLGDIWHPNWLIANAAGSVDRSFPEIVQVAGDGMVNYRQRLIGSFAQSLDLRAFPFDHATFRVHLVMVGQKPAEIQFVPNERAVAAGMPTGAGIAPGLTLQDWRVSDPTARALPYKAAPGFEFAGYAFEFRAERLVQHYIVKVILPLLMIVMMSWAAFWIDPKLGSTQISIAVTSMLTLIAYRFAVGADLPKLPYLTDLDAFILISSVLVLLTLIESIVTSTMESNERLDRARTLDRYCRWVFPVAYAVVTAATFLR
ncbi:MAG: hypothetical protein AABP62_31605, partial [Planctomycetota bacterium]